MNDLNPQQWAAVDHKDGPILIVAGAGSGKTRTLTQRLARLIESGIKPENIVAITFTNKAAGEMLSRVNKLIGQPESHRPFISTFHSFGARILKKESRSLNRTPSFIIYDQDDSLSLIKSAMKTLEISKEDYNPLIVRNKISRVKNELLDPTEYLDKRTLVIFGKYEEALTKNNGFDFDDLIEKVVWLFRKHPEILKKYQNQFQCILVDEFQDINTAQYQLIKLLAGGHNNLSVVGDDQQAIYSFRSADFRNFLNFENDWPKAKIVKLEQNYRSTVNIIAAASEIIKNNKLQKSKTLWTKNKEGSLIEIAATTDQEEEAVFVAEKIDQLISVHKLDRKNEPAVAILYRTNAQSRAIEQALIARHIPYKIFGGLKFYERKEVKDVIAGLRLAFNPQDSISAERIKKTFKKDEALYLCRELPRLGGQYSILEIIKFFLESGNYFDYLDHKFQNSRERIENINELITFASEFKDLGEFLERVALLQSTDNPSKSRSTDDHPQTPVNLMTIHLAKGLEFSRVFVIGCDEGILPHKMSYNSPDEIEEERRLMYVAMTRAREELCLSFAHIPSRFLYEIPPALTKFTNLKSGHSALPDEEEIYIE